jgi:DNA-3-methyladenine glycosylase II
VKLIKIENEQTLNNALLELVKNDFDMARVVKCVEKVNLRSREDGFQALLRAIVGQQLSVKAAAAIWGRLEKADFVSEKNINLSTDEQLRECGLSRQKVNYARALAIAKIDYKKLHFLSTDQATEILVKVSGIGRWTAEIYAMFSLNHPDVFPAGDLALQEATRILYNLKDRPKEKEMRQIAQRWKPWRSVASLALWEYYAKNKNREGV